MATQILNLHELNPQRPVDFLPEYGLQRWSPDYIRFLQGLTYYKGLIAPITYQLMPPFTIRIQDVVWCQDSVLGHWKSSGVNVSHYLDLNFTSPTDFRGQEVYVVMSYTYGPVYSEPTFSIVPITQTIEDFEASNPDQFVALKVRVPAASSLEIGAITQLNINSWDVSLAKPVANRLFEEFYNSESYSATSSDGVLKGVGNSLDLNYTAAGRLFGIKAGLARIGTQWMRTTQELQVVVPTNVTAATKKAGVMFGYSPNGLMRVYVSNAVTASSDIPPMFYSSYPSGFLPLWYVEVLYDALGVPSIIQGSKRDLRQFSYPSALGHRPNSLNDPIATGFVDGVHPLVADNPVAERIKIVLDQQPTPVGNLSLGTVTDRGHLQLNEPAVVSDRAMKVYLTAATTTRFWYKYNIYSLNSLRLFFRAKTSVSGSAKMTMGVVLYDSNDAQIADVPLTKEWLALPSAFYEFDTILDPQIFYQATPLSDKKYVSYFRLYFDCSNDNAYALPNYIFIHDFRIGGYIGNALPSGFKTDFVAGLTPDSNGKYFYTFNHNLGTKQYHVFAYVDYGQGAGDEQISPRVFARGINTCQLEFDAPYTNLKIVICGGQVAGNPRVIDLADAAVINMGTYDGLNLMVPYIDEFTQAMRFTDSPIFRGLTVVDPTSIGATPHYYLQTWQSGATRELRLGDANPAHDVAVRIMGDLYVDGTFNKISQDVLVGSSLLKLNGTSPYNLDSSFETKWLEAGGSPDRAVSAFNATANTITFATTSHGITNGSYFDILGATSAGNDGGYRATSVAGAVVTVDAAWKPVAQTEAGGAAEAVREFNPRIRWNASSIRWDFWTTALSVLADYGTPNFLFNGTLAVTNGIVETSIMLSAGEELRAADNTVMADGTGAFLRMAGNATLRRASINPTTGAITAGTGGDIYQNSGADDGTPRGQFAAEKVWGMVWADFADFQLLAPGSKGCAGRAFVRTRQGLTQATRRCQPGVSGIHSDTFAYAAGTRPHDHGPATIPLGVAGFVLAYVDHEYEPGTPLVNDARGGLTRARLWERVFYAHRILAVYDRPEPQPVFGSQAIKIQVQGRHWVKV